jgi:hypothetical protein
MTAKCASCRAVILTDGVTVLQCKLPREPSHVRHRDGVISWSGAPSDVIEGPSTAVKPSCCKTLGSGFYPCIEHEEAGYEQRECECFACAEPPTSACFTTDTP